MSNSYDPYSSYPSSSKDTSGADHDFDFDHLLVSTEGERERKKGKVLGRSEGEGRESIPSLSLLLLDAIENEEQKRAQGLPTRP